MDSSEARTNPDIENSSTSEPPSEATGNSGETSSIELELGDYRILIQIGNENEDHSPTLLEDFTRPVSPDTISASRNSVLTHTYPVHRATPNSPMTQEVPFFSTASTVSVNPPTCSSFGSGYVRVDPVLTSEFTGTPYRWIQSCPTYDRIFIGNHSSEFIHPHTVYPADQRGGEWAGRRNIIHIIPGLSSFPTCSVCKYIWAHHGSLRSNFLTSSHPLNMTGGYFAFDFQQYNMMAPQHESLTQFLNPQCGNSFLGSSTGTSWHSQGNRNMYSDFSQGNSINTLPSLGAMSYSSSQISRPCCSGNSSSRQVDINEPINQLWSNRPSLLNPVFPVSSENLSPQQPSGSYIRLSLSLRQSSVTTQPATRPGTPVQDPLPRQPVNPWTLEPWEPALITNNPWSSPSRPWRQERDVTSLPKNSNNSTKN